MCKILRHKNITITQIYVKILNEKVGKETQKIYHKFKEMESCVVSQL